MHFMTGIKLCRGFCFLLQSVTVDLTLSFVCACVCVGRDVCLPAF